MLLIYAILVLIIIVMSLLAISNFWRYRFQGDRTSLVIILFIVAFILTMGATLILLDPTAFNPTTGDFVTTF